MRADGGEQTSGVQVEAEPTRCKWPAATGQWRGANPTWLHYYYLARYKLARAACAIKTGLPARAAWPNKAAPKGPFGAPLVSERAGGRAKQALPRAACRFVIMMDERVERA